MRAPEFRPDFAVLADVTQEDVFQRRLLALQPVQRPACGHGPRDGGLDAVAHFHLAFDR